MKIVSLNVRYKSATVDEFIDNHAHDVSRGGIYIKTASPFSPGTLLKFEIRLASDQAVIAGVGRVVWKRDAAQTTTERPAGMGVKFIKLDDPSKAVIEKLVNTRSDAGRAYESEAEVPAESPMATTQTIEGSSVPPPPRTSVAPAAASASTAPAPAPAPAGGSIAPGASPLARKATMVGLGVSPPAAIAATQTRRFSSSGPPSVPRPAGGGGMFPRTLSEAEMPPKGEQTVMKQAAELLEEALREAGGSMEEVGTNPLFSGNGPFAPRTPTVKPAVEDKTLQIPATPSPRPSMPSRPPQASSPEIAAPAGALATTAVMATAPVTVVSPSPVPPRSPTIPPTGSPSVPPIPAGAPIPSVTAQLTPTGTAVMTPDEADKARAMVAGISRAPDLRPPPQAPNWSSTTAPYAAGKAPPYGAVASASPVARASVPEKPAKKGGGGIFIALFTLIAAGVVVVVFYRDRLFSSAPTTPTAAVTTAASPPPAPSTTAEALPQAPTAAAPSIAPPVPASASAASSAPSTALATASVAPWPHPAAIVRPRPTAVVAPKPTPTESEAATAPTTPTTAAPTPTTVVTTAPTTTAAPVATTTQAPATTSAPTATTPKRPAKPVDDNPY